MQTQGSCSWTASTADSWIRITQSSGTGSGDVRFSVESNDGPARAGAIAVGGVSVRVEQEGERPERVTLNGSVSNLKGSCPSLTFTLDGETVFTDADTEFKGKDGCAAVANGTRAEGRRGGGRWRPGLRDQGGGAVNVRSTRERLSSRRRWSRPVP